MEEMIIIILIIGLFLQKKHFAGSETRPMTFDLYQWSVLTTLTRHLLDCDLSNVIGDGMFVLVGLCELWVDPAPPPQSSLTPIS